MENHPAPTASPSIQKWAELTVEYWSPILHSPAMLGFAFPRFPVWLRLVIGLPMMGLCLMTFLFVGGKVVEMSFGWPMVFAIIAGMAMVVLPGFIGSLFMWYEQLDDGRVEYDTVLGFLVAIPLCLCMPRIHLALLALEGPVWLTGLSLRSESSS